MEKRSHLGMAGHYAAMSEFLCRGYNIAVPAVDIGDDAYIVEDQAGTMWRLQVKTSDQSPDIATYGISRRQLREVKANELFFMFMLRLDVRWRFILIAREKLVEVRDAYERQDRDGKRGRPPTSDIEATTDKLMLKIKWGNDDATGWGQSFKEYLDRWPETFPPNPDGPGAVSVRASAR